MLKIKISIDEECFLGLFFKPLAPETVELGKKLIVHLYSHFF
jgi:hypothetical protein